MSCVRMPSGEIWNPAAFVGFRKVHGKQIEIWGVLLNAREILLYSAVDAKEADMILEMIAAEVGAESLDTPLEIDDAALTDIMKMLARGEDQS